MRKDTDACPLTRTWGLSPQGPLRFWVGSMEDGEWLKAQDSGEAVLGGSVGDLAVGHVGVFVLTGRV